jgi:hypothetical protein
MESTRVKEDSSTTPELDRNSEAWRSRFVAARYHTGYWLIQDPLLPAQKEKLAEELAKMRDLEHYLKLDWRFSDIVEKVKKLRHPILD